MEPEVEFISIPKPSRVAIIGAGMVGSTYAYTLLLQESRTRSAFWTRDNPGLKEKRST